MWEQRRADRVRAGDCVMVNEPAGWHPRVVRSVVPDGAHVLLRYSDDGMTVTVRFPRDAMIEVW